MDASIYTEPIKTREGKAAKTVKPPHRKTDREVASLKRTAKLNAEFGNAKNRLHTIIFRKEGGMLTIRLGHDSLELLAASPGIISSKKGKQEMWGLLCQRLDSHGLVNHRVVGEEAMRLTMISEILEQSLQEGRIEKITRRSKVIIMLSNSVTRTEKIASDAHERRLAAKPRCVKGEVAA